MGWPDRWPPLRLLLLGQIRVDTTREEHLVVDEQAHRVTDGLVILDGCFVRLGDSHGVGLVRLLGLLRRRGSDRILLLVFIHRGRRLGLGRLSEQAVTKLRDFVQNSPSSVDDVVSVLLEGLENAELVRLAAQPTGLFLLLLRLLGQIIRVGNTHDLSSWTRKWELYKPRPSNKLLYWTGFLAMSVSQS